LKDQKLLQFVNKILLNQKISEENFIIDEIPIVQKAVKILKN